MLWCCTPSQRLLWHVTKSVCLCTRITSLLSYVRMCSRIAYYVCCVLPCNTVFASRQSRHRNRCHELQMLCVFCCTPCYATHTCCVCMIMVLCSPVYRVYGYIITIFMTSADHTTQSRHRNMLQMLCGRCDRMSWHANSILPYSVYAMLYTAMVVAYYSMLAYTYVHADVMMLCNITTVVTCHTCCVFVCTHITSLLSYYVCSRMVLRT